MACSLVTGLNQPSKEKSAASTTEGVKNTTIL
jgi:hypothetical protein